MTKARKLMMNMPNNISVFSMPVLIQERSTVWVDDFNILDTSKWAHELGYVRNSELQLYTDSSANTFIRDGQLVLKAIKDTNGNWTSASVHTNNMFEVGNAKIEAKIKFPQQAGAFPAFWMLGAGLEIDYSTQDYLGDSWLDAREIDIVESFGYANTVQAGVFYQAGGSDTSLSHSSSVSSWVDITQFHIYTLQKTDTTLNFYIDNVLYHTYTVTDSGVTKPFYILLDLAVGAAGGQPDETTSSEFEMVVDYVRVTTLDGSVPVLPSGISLDTSTYTGYVVGATKKIVATILPSTAQNKTITWTSSDTNVATVYGGKLKVINNGTCVITAKTYNGLTATCSITVAIPADGIVASDTFTRADSVVSMGTSETGQIWQYSGGTWGIASGKSYAVATTNGDSAYVDCGTANVEVSSDFTLTDYASLTLRYVDLSNNYRLKCSDGNIKLFKMISGVATQIGTTYTTSIIVGDTFNLKAVLIGSSIKAYYNDVLILDVTDSTYLTPTKHGYYAYSALGDKFDNFKIKTM